LTNAFNLTILQTFNFMARSKSASKSGEKRESDEADETSHFESSSLESKILPTPDQN
jgi:hypothetical protein